MERLARSAAFRETRRIALTPLVDSSSRKVGMVAGLTALIVTGGTAALGGSRYLLFRDGRLFRVVARWPFSDGRGLRPLAPLQGDAYRYGRVLYPLLAWLISLGHADWTTATLGIVTVLAVAAAAAFAAELFRRAGRPPERGLILLTVPAMAYSMGVLLSEPLVIALILATYLLWIDDRKTEAMISGALLLLAREAAMLALVPLVLESWRRDRREAARWGLAALPYVGWATWVRLRVGQWPFTDPSLARRQALGIPGVAYNELIRANVGLGIKAVIVGLGIVAVATFAAACYVSVTRPGLLSYGALSLAILALLLGRQAVGISIDGLRVIGPAQVLILVAVAQPRVRAGRCGDELGSFATGET